MMFMRTGFLVGASLLAGIATASAGNVASIGQRGVYSGAFTEQSGRNNYSFQSQNGYANGALTVQTGRNNSAGIRQNGYYNGAAISQSRSQPSSMP